MRAGLRQHGFKLCDARAYHVGFFARSVSLLFDLTDKLSGLLFNLMGAPANSLRSTMLDLLGSLLNSVLRCLMDSMHLTCCFRAGRVKGQPRELLDLSGFRSRRRNGSRGLGGHRRYDSWVDPDRDILLEEISLIVLLMKILLIIFLMKIMLVTLFVHVHVEVNVLLHCKVVVLMQAQPWGSSNIIRRTTHRGVRSCAR